MRKFEIILFLSLAAYLVLSGVRGFDKDYRALQNDVVRIHIMANSDANSDQELKLRVRDAILGHSSKWLENCNDSEQAQEIINAHLGEINDIARSEIQAAGYDYDVNSQIVKMDFEDRVYGNITMPRGNYTALRVTIGEAKGHNWWCVMYPPLCIPAAGSQDVELEDYTQYFSDGEIKILENCSGYEIRFKCAEIYNSIKEKI
ncbi:MAG: stage II sporulation protein R [Oscillospiraceae bacterium]|nr:stage II sporulation protein R [Oscillospiraceae bacterium]